MWKVKLVLAAACAVVLLALTHPAGFRTVTVDLMLAGIALLGLAVVVLAGMFAGHCCRVRGNRQAAADAAGRRTLHDLPPAAREPATALDLLTAGIYAMPAPAVPRRPPCAGGCGRPAEAAVSYADGRPPAQLCRHCLADTAVSDARVPGGHGGCCGHGVPPEPDGSRRCGICDLPAPGHVPAAPDNAPPTGEVDLTEYETGS